MSDSPRRPEPSEFPAAFAAYVGKVPELDPIPVLDGQPGEVRARLASVAPASESYRYAPEKWSLRELVGHVIDTERVFAFRALAFARGEQAPLPGFDENDYARHAGADARPLSDLLEELDAVRRGNVLLLRGLPSEAWDRVGTANGKPITVRALAFAMAGHVRHHLEVLESRYLTGLATGA